MLQNSLGGNSATSILCCMHPGREHYSETISTLKFAHRAKCVTNKVTANQKLSAEQWKLKYEEAQAKIETLEKQLELARGTPGSVILRGAQGGSGPMSSNWKMAIGHARRASLPPDDPADAAATSPQHRGELDAMRAQVETLSMKLSQEVDDCQALKEELAEKKQTIVESASRITYVETELQRVTERCQLKERENELLQSSGGDERAQHSALQETLADLEAEKEANDLLTGALEEKKQERDEAIEQQSRVSDQCEALRDHIAKRERDLSQYVETLKQRDITIDRMRKALADDLVPLMKRISLYGTQTRELLKFAKDATPEQGDAIQQLAGKLYDSEAQHELLDLLDILQQQREEEYQFMLERTNRCREKKTDLQPPTMCTGARKAGEESRKVLVTLNAASFFEEEDEMRRLSAIRYWEELAYQFEELVLTMAECRTVTGDDQRKQQGQEWKRLVGMGFAEQDAKEAYSACGGDFGAAAAMLMDRRSSSGLHSSGVPTPAHRSATAG